MAARDFAREPIHGRHDRITGFFVVIRFDRVSLHDLDGVGRVAIAELVDVDVDAKLRSSPLDGLSQPKSRSSSGSPSEMSILRMAA